MNQSEFRDFSTLLVGIADYYGKTLQPATIQLYWNALSRLEFEAVKRLLNAHIQTSRFMPSIAEILDACRAMDGRPDAEAAWAVVARSLNDEGVTVVWTEEMAAAFGVALGLQNDRVAARMAFKEAYERLVREARARGVPVRWMASLGHDVGGREGPLMAAVKEGRLTADQVVGLLPHRADPSPEVRALFERQSKLLGKPGLSRGQGVNESFTAPTT